MATRILVVIGTPLAGSLNHALAHSYATRAREAGAEVRIVDLAVDPIPAHPRTLSELKSPRPGDPELDADVAGYMNSVEWANHIALFYPQWWGTYPAAFKAFVDRVLLTGFAYRYVGKRGWQRLLTGRTARIVTTMDAPGWWNLMWYWRASDVSLRRATLWYCGIKVIGTRRLALVRHTTPATRERWIAAMGSRGSRDARRAVPATRNRTPIHGESQEPARIR